MFMDPNETLVIILSAALAIFMVLAIVFAIYSIRIARRVHEITEMARAAAGSVEAAAKIFEKTAAPAAFSRILANIIEGWQKGSKSKRKD
jgi:hypothetical protein